MDYSNLKEREAKAKVIAARYADLYATANGKQINKVVLCLILQVLSTAHDHAGVDYPIDLERLELQSDVDFIHDIMGAVANFNIRSCTFKNMFIPRCGFFNPKRVCRGTCT